MRHEFGYFTPALPASVARDLGDPTRCGELKDASDYGIVQPRRDEAVSKAVARTWHRMQVEARPGELVDFVDNDPRARIVEAERLFYPRRQLDGLSAGNRGECVIGATVTRGPRAA